MFFVQGLFPKDRHRPFSAVWANPWSCWTSRNTNPCQLYEMAPFCVPGLQERKINPIAERVSMFPSSHSFPSSSFPPHFHIHSLLAVQTVSVRLLLVIFIALLSSYSAHLFSYSLPSPVFLSLLIHFNSHTSLLPSTLPAVCSSPLPSMPCSSQYTPVLSWFCEAQSDLLPRSRVVLPAPHSNQLSPALTTRTPSFLFQINSSTSCFCLPSFHIFFITLSTQLPLTLGFSATQTSIRAPKLCEEVPLRLWHDFIPPFHLPKHIVWKPPG